jgi:HEAT repeat protein
MWLGLVLLGAACPAPAEEDDIPAPRVLTAREWDGVQAAHDDPRPAVRRAAEELMQHGIEGWYGSWDQRIGGYRHGRGTERLPVPFTTAAPESLPPWTKPPPEPEAALPPPNTAEGRWARVKQEVGWDGYYKTLDPTRHAPIAAALLENEDLELVEEALKALHWMDARAWAPQIASIAFHREEHIAATAIYVLGDLKAKDQADMLAVLVKTRPALRTWSMSALARLGDKRAVSIALDLLRSDEYHSAVSVLKDLGGPEHGPAIAACLSSENEDIQVAVLETLAAVKAETEAEAVARLLEPGYDQRVHKQAITTLGALNARQFSGRIAALMTDNDVVWACTDALAKLRAIEHAPSVEALLVKAESYETTEAFQVQCVRTLFRMGALTRAEAVKRLEAVVRETDFSGWYGSASLFIELDAIESLETLLRLRGTPMSSPAIYWKDYEAPPDVLRELGFAARCSEIAWFLQSSEPAVVIGALDALSEFWAAEFVPQITALLSWEEPESVRLAALHALFRFRTKVNAAPVAALLDSREPMALRKDALFLLEMWDADDITAEVAALLSASEPNELRSPALKLFAGLKGTEPFADRLLALTKANLPLNERIEALAVLQTVDPSPGLERLRELLRPAEAKKTRLAVLGMLASQPVKEAAPLIAALLAEEDEQILHAALNALSGSGGEAQVDQVLPWLRHHDSHLQRSAAGVLYKLGPRGRSRLFEEANDPVLRGIAVKAMMEHDESDLAILSRTSDVPPDALIARAVFWARRREQGVAPALAESLQHSNPTVREASLAALLVCGGGPHRYTVLLCLEAAVRFPDEAGPLLLAAYLFATPEERTALPWLGGRQDEYPPAIPQGAEERADLLSSLWRMRVLLNREDFPNLRHDLPRSAEVIITSAADQWTGADLPLLESVAADMQQMPWAKDNAAAVAATVREVRANTPLRRTLRWSAWILGGQLVLWVLVLLLYPWSVAAQRMMWSRALRRGLGWWVEPLVLRTPWLRDRLWRPFREQLVPPAEVLTFDEWTFFDAVRIAPENGAPCPALPVLRLWRGAGVLRGESGLGKTTLLQAIVSASPRPSVLLRAVECSGGLTAAIQARLPRGVRGDTEFLRALLMRGSPDVYVDAVQEAPAEVQARLTKDAESLRGGNILFTTQPCAWTPPAGAMVWDVQPLRAADIAPFLLKQGTAAIEAAGGQSLAERQRAFTARVQTFLDELSALPPDDPRAAAQRRMLSNPMEAVLAAELLAAGQTPDPARLLEQRMEHLEEDFAAEQGGAFPARPFAKHLLAWRQSGRPDPDLEQFDGVASFLARHRLLRKTGETGWRFRHDKILDWFLRPALPV